MKEKRENLVGCKVKYYKRGSKNLEVGTVVKHSEKSELEVVQSTGLIQRVKRFDITDIIYPTVHGIYRAKRVR